MGRREARPKMIFRETETVGHLIEAGYGVWARCSKCNTSTRLDLEQIRAEKGPLFTFWNKHPACKACDTSVTFQAKKADKADYGRAWPIHMSDADPEQVAFIEARWRADQLGNDLGAALSLRLAVEALRFVSRLGVGSERDWRVMVDNAVNILPTERRDDGRWLIQHYLERDQDRPGWR